MSSATTFFEPLRRREYTIDDDGAVAYVKAELDEKKITWNLTDWLESGETVSSAAYEDSGVTTSNKSVSSPSVIFTVTGLGETTVTVTSSNSRTFERTFRFRAPTGRTPADYA